MGFFTDVISAPYNAVTGQQTQWQKDADLAEGRAQIQAVADNVQKYYSDVVVQQAAQAAADANKAALAGDLSHLNAVQAKDGCGGGVDLSGVGLGCINSFSDLLAKLDTAVKIALAVGAVIGIIYVWTVFVAPFVKVRR
jgi:hypothetical protein